MPQLPLDCPYCSTQKAGFQGHSYVPFKPGATSEYLVLMQCQICGNGIVAKFRSGHPSNFQQWFQGQAGMQGVALLETFPKPNAVTAPEYTPDNVGRFYLQGMDNLARNFDAAGTMFRKSLDAALKYVHPTGKGTNLEKRINDLPAATGVTPAMQTWAHEIRHLGNDAAHEEDPFTEPEAQSLQAFTELFLTYVFTLPGMLAARKAAAQDPRT